MKKLQVMGLLTPEALAAILPALVTASVDFIVEDVPDESPPAHLATAAIVHSVLAAPTPQPVPQPAATPQPAADYQFLGDRVLQWLREADGYQLTYPQLRALMQKAGYSGSSAYDAVGRLRKRGKAYVEHGVIHPTHRPRPMVRTPYGKPVGEYVLDVVAANQPIPRTTLVDELETLGIHKPTADVAVHKAITAGGIKYIGDSTIPAAGGRMSPLVTLPDWERPRESTAQVNERDLPSFKELVDVTDTNTPSH